MSLYGRKPGLVDAAQWKVATDNGLWFVAVILWLDQHGFDTATDQEGNLIISTSTVGVTVRVGDWITIDRAGGLHVYDPEIFEATYEKIEANNER